MLLVGFALYSYKLISLWPIPGVFQQYFVYQVQKIRLQVQKLNSLSDIHIVYYFLGFKD
jgi:hypothetical protein